jgi:TP901 family phage tail tape measure protein
VAEGVLPPAVQIFVAESEDWIAGIDSMIAANDRLIASIREVAEAAKESGLAEGETATAGAGAGGAAGAADAEAADAKIVAGNDEVIDSNKAVMDSYAELSQVEIDSRALFAEVDAQQGAMAAETAAAIDASNDSIMASMKLRGDVAMQTNEKTAAGFKMMGLAALAGAAISVHMAADFQQSMTRLVTSAGETQKNLGMVSRGILNLSVSTNTSTSQLAQGMYYVESAGYHGAAGLEVLKAAAQGAQAEGAQLSTVSNAVTTALNAYGLKAGSATAVTNEMVTAVAHGKMTMQDLAGSIAEVLPVAAKAHLSLAQVAGAEATMTAQGFSAQQSAQNLRHVIMSLSNPTQVQTTEMGQLGLNAVHVAHNLGKEGLTGTINTLSEAILKNMGKSGYVMLKAFNQSKLAAQSATTMMNAMPPSIRGVAEAYSEGKISAQQWQQIVYKGTESALQKNLLEQYAAVENKAKGFNDVLKAGGGNVQTYNAAMSKMTGGITGTTVALMLSGNHAAVFNQNVQAISRSAQTAGKNVDNWALIQHNFNFQLGSAEKAVEAMAISFGSALLPVVTPVIHGIADVAGWLARTTVASKALAIVIGGILAVVFERKLAQGLKASGTAMKNLIKDGKDLWHGLQSVWQKLTGAQQAQASASDAQAAAADGESASADAQAASSDAVTAATEAQAGAAGTAAAAMDVEAASTDVVAASTDVATASMWAFIASILASPITWIVVGIAAVVVGIVELAKHCQWFRDIWRDLWGGIEAAAKAVWNWIKSNWPLLVGILLGPIALVAAEIVKHWKAIEDGVKKAWDECTKIVKKAWDDIKKDISNALDWIWNLIDRVLLDLSEDWDHAWARVKQLADDAADFLKRIFHDIGRAVDNFADKVIRGFEHLRNDALLWLAKMLLDVIKWGKHMVHDVLSFVTDMFSAGVHLIEGLIRGFLSKAGSLVSAAEHVGSEFLSAVGSFFGMGSPSRVMHQHGIWIAQGLANGIHDGGPMVTAAIRSMLQSTGLGGSTLTGVLRADIAGGENYGALPGGAGGAAGGGVTVNLTVQGSVVTQQQLQQLIQQEILRYTHRNTGNGVVLQNRGH